MRRRFSGTIYGTFEMTQRAMAAESINKMLDEGKRVWGKLSPDADEWGEIDEALEPRHWSILCRMKDGGHREIHGYDGTRG